MARAAMAAAGAARWSTASCYGAMRDVFGVKDFVMNLDECGAEPFMLCQLV